MPRYLLHAHFLDRHHTTVPIHCERERERESGTIDCIFYRLLVLYLWWYIHTYSEDFQFSPNASM